MGKAESESVASHEPQWVIPGSSPLTANLRADTAALTSAFTSSPGTDASSDLKDMRRLIDQLEARWLEAAAGFATTCAMQDDGSPTLAAWLRHKCRIAPAEAGSRARVAQAITSGELQTTGQAMKAGHLSWRHAAVIEATVRDAPVDQRGAAEEALQEPARQLDPMLLRRVGAELLHRLDVEKAELAAVRRLERRGLDIAETFDGMVAVNGLLDPMAGAALLTAVDAKVQPTRGDDADRRTWSQRRADGLSEICREWLDLGDTPQVGGHRPHLSVMIDLAALRKEPRSGSASLEWVGPITAEQARMIACDASISRVLTDGPSQILDVGRATRTILPGIRRAVVARDGTCVASGCYRPPQHCDAHHIVFWEDGGHTSVDNLVLLCRRHHGFVHERGWRVVDDEDGRRTLVPPTSRPPPDYSLP